MSPIPTLTYLRQLQANWPDIEVFHCKGFPLTVNQDLSAVLFGCLIIGFYVPYTNPNLFEAIAVKLARYRGIPLQGVSANSQSRFVRCAPWLLNDRFLCPLYQP